MLLLLLWQQWSLSIESNIKCPNTAEKYNCWRDELENILNRKGLSASFDVLAVLYETEPDFVSECHGYTHELGEKAYFLFSRYKNIEMTPKASYCGYGFYHGFIETMLDHFFIT
ncbi:hypothetical protein K8Q98_01635 [Candidatus Nomurabacteria bacterium]|nr:hypothetical protein [Candidatus Nomurabacteria bacterium]